MSVWIGRRIKEREFDVISWPWYDIYLYGTDYWIVLASSFTSTGEHPPSGLDISPKSLHKSWLAQNHTLLPSIIAKLHLQLKHSLPLLWLC
jgi:hypothetical protein